MGNFVIAAPKLSSGSDLCDQDQPNGARDDGLVGAEPIDHVVMMEDHDDAYYAWQKAGIRDRILVHIDAHIDFGWIAERDPAELLELRSLREVQQQSAETSLWNFSGRSKGKLIHIGNYINPALQEGIVRSFYWVVPDAFLGNLRQQKLLEKMLNNLRETRPRAVEKVTWVNGSLRGTIYGKPLTVCSLSDLPEFEDSVLLDIDTDFLVIDSISASYPYADLAKTTPWIWSEELVSRLQERQLRTDFVTIAYSVEGGYTPLGYKYLGDNLAKLIRDPRLARGDRSIMALKRRAALYRAENKILEARDACETALAAHSDDASIHYQLAELSSEQGQADQAQGHYQQAVALDPSYRTAYNNFGPVYLTLGQLPQSGAEYQKALTFDPDNADAWAGLGDLSSEQKEWEKAIVQFKRAIDLRPDDSRAHLGLGYAYLKLRNWSAAEEELKHALTSEKPSGLAQYWLGEVYWKKRRRDDALGAYRAAWRLGVRHLSIHLRLGWLYLRNRNFYQANRHYGKAARLLPARLLASLRRLRTRIGKMLSRSRHDAQPR